MALSATEASVERPARRSRSRFGSGTRLRWRRLTPEIVLGLLMVVMVVVLLFEGRGTTFFGDEWDFIQHRSGEKPLLDELLTAHNEHFSLVPVLIYKLLFATVGLHPYWPYRLALALMHLLCVVLVWKLVRPRVGGWPGLLAVTPLLFLGAAGENLLWPFQMSFLASIAAGLGGLLAVDRDTRSADALASALVFTALASSALGLPFVVAVAARILAGERRGWKRLWLLAAPVVLYGLWYSGYGNSTVAGGDLPLAPEWAMNAFAGGTGALFGLGIEWGRSMAIVVTGLVGWNLSKSGPLPARLVSYVALGSSFWLLLGLGRPELPEDTSRYLYLGAFAVVLMLTEVAAGHSFGPRVLGVAGVVVGIGVLANLGRLHGLATGTYRWASDDVLPQLAAVELARSGAVDDYRLNAVYLTPVFARTYLAATQRIGDSPAPSADELDGGSSPEGRMKADRILLDFGALSIQPNESRAGAVAPRLLTAKGGRVARGGGCVTVGASGRSAPVTITLILPRRGIRLRSGDGPVAVRARRFGDAFAEGVIPPGVPPRTTWMARASPDVSSVPWKVRLDGSSRLSVCSRE